MPIDTLYFDDWSTFLVEWWTNADGIIVRIDTKFMKQKLINFQYFVSTFKRIYPVQWAADKTHFSPMIDPPQLCDENDCRDTCQGFSSTLVSNPPTITLLGSSSRKNGLANIFDKKFYVLIRNESLNENDNWIKLFMKWTVPEASPIAKIVETIKHWMRFI